MTRHLSAEIGLEPHPESSCPAVRAIGVAVGWRPGESLTLRFTLKAELKNLRIPKETDPRRVDGLWQHTCFEAFVGWARKPAYYEFNFAPSGAWAVYQFQAYRDGMQTASATLVPRMSRSMDHEQFMLEAVVPLLSAPDVQRETCLRMALSAVIEDRSGMKTYWALRHPPGKPDFHHPESFALILGEPS